jgi:hypothetical protein
MANYLDTGQEISIPALVTGIVNDAQNLLKQQLSLFKYEIQADIRKTKQAVLVLGVGMGITLVGLWFLFLMLVYFLAWSTSLPLWSCYGLVGLGLSAVGGLLIYRAKRKFDVIHPLPEQSARALEENIQCLTNLK